MHPSVARLIVTLGITSLSLVGPRAWADPEGLPPLITFTDPPTGVVTIIEETNQLFTVTASDPEGSNLVYQWRVGNLFVGEDSPSFVTNTSWGDAGIYFLKVDIFDGDWTNTAAWTVRITPDNDADGIGNWYESEHPFLNPWDRTDATNDLDGDGLINLREFLGRTSMTNADSDGDGLQDGWELRYGFDPNSATGVIEEVNILEDGEWRFPFDGDAMAVACTGTTAFVALNGGGLRVFDISDPSNAVPIGGIEPQGGSTLVGVTLVGNLLYMADFSRGLLIVDVSAAANPMVVGTYEISSATDVAVDGGWAYVGSVTEGLVVLDISEPTTPQRVGSLHAVGYPVLSVQVRGDLVYAAAGPAGLAVVDVSDHAQPRLLGRAETPFARDVALSEAYAFVADNSVGLVAVSILDPTNPVVQAVPGISGAALKLEGSNLYVSAGYTFSVVDVNTAPDLAIVGSVDLDASSVGLDVTGSLVCLAATDRLILLDMSSPLIPVVQGSVPTLGLGYKAEVRGATAYVAGGPFGLFTVDISDPAAPMQLGNLSIPGGATSLALGDGFALVTYDHAREGIVAVDLTDPANPSALATLDFEHTIGGIDLEDSRAYLFTYVNEFETHTQLRLHVVDVTSPDNLVTNGSLALNGDVYDLDALGAYVYLATSSGLTIVDVANPAMPEVVGQVSLPTFAKAVTVSNTYAYVVDGETRAHVIDVSNPANAGVVATAPGAFFQVVHNIVLDAGYGYVGTDEGFRVLDVRDPLQPTWISGWPDSYNPYGRISAGDGRVYQNTLSGFRILRLAPVDTDGDGLPDFWEQLWFENLDRDGRGDFDGDGIIDIGEYTGDLNPLEADQDGDTVIDGAEVNTFQSDPRSAHSDDDSLADGEEVVLGADGFVTSPIEADTDGDVVPDPQEVALGRDPTVAESAYVTVFGDDVEDGGTNWLAGGSWEVGHDDYSSAFSSWTESPWGRYARGRTSFLSLGTPIDLSGYKHAWVRFRHTLMTDGDATAAVAVSTDGGQSWSEALAYNGFQHEDWSDEMVPISDFCGYPDVRIGFLFTVPGVGLATTTGWHLDDIAVLALNSEVRGIVEGAGSALPDAQIMLRPMFATSDEYTAWLFTEANGAYAFDMAIPGTYVVKADAAAYGAEFYAGVTRPSEASPVELAFGETRMVDFNLRSGQSPGQIYVTSEPAGAMVYLDFEPQGVQTPSLLSDIEPGSHFVSVSKPGYPAVAPKGVGVFEAEMASVDFNLDVPTGAIRVESAPLSGATVYLDFLPTGLTTPCLLTNVAADLPAASHFVSVSKAGLSAPGPVQTLVYAGETNLVSFTLPADGFGDLLVTSSPTGAVVWLDFLSISNRTDVLLEDLAAGSHTVRVSLPGFGTPAARGVMVETGAISRVHFNLGVADHTDADGDDLPDAWEHASGLSATSGSNTNGADGDWDGDTMSNADEWQAGTSPTDPFSLLELFQVTRGTNTNLPPFSITWQTVPGKRYRVDAKQSLTEPTWTFLTEFETAQGDSRTFVEEAFPGISNRLYRIVVLPYP